MTQAKDSSEREKKQIQEDVERLKDWLEKQPHLPHNIDEEFLRGFVLGTKSLEIAKQKLDAWFSCKNRFPHLFSPEARNPLTALMKDSVKAIKLFFLPKLSPEGCLVHWIKIGEDLSGFSHSQFVIRNAIQLEVALKLYPECKGYMCVYDTAGLHSPSFLAKMSPTAAGAGLQWFQGAFPMKLKKALIVNSSSGIEMVVNTIFKPFLKPKLFSRIKVTTEGEKFITKHIPIDMLPEDYGGNEKDSQLLNEEWQRKLEEKADWLQDISKLVSDEKKRPADSNCTYGVEGTFRKLALD